MSCTEATLRCASAWPRSAVTIWASERKPSAVSTSGASPALARRIRDDLDETLGPEYAAAVDTLAKLRGRYAPGPRRQAAFMRIVDGGLLDALRGGDGRRVDELIAAACTGLPEQAAAGGTR